MPTQDFEKKVEKICDERKVPGVVFVGGDAEGTYKYEKAFGRRSLKDLSKPDPLSLDTPMWLASCSKIATTVSAMQMVEQGKIGIDDDVSEILHELKGVQILKGFEEESGKPILVDNSTPITLRMMLTHSAGLTYLFMSPTIGRYRQQVDDYPVGLWIGNDDTFERVHKSPLAYEPGTSWEYGCGIDWAGLIVERLTNQPLSVYAQENIWTPLGVTSITFNIGQNSEALEKLADMNVRSGGEDAFGAAKDPEGLLEYAEPTFNSKISFDNGGAGSYGPPADFQKLLHSLCVSDGKLLKKETIDFMFRTDHLTESAKKAIQATFQIPRMREGFAGGKTFAGGETEFPVTFGLGGLLFLEDWEGGRRKGTMGWVGYPNLLWFVDRVGGVSGVMGSQLTPTGDGLMNELNAEFERGIYREAGKL